MAFPQHTIKDAQIDLETFDKLLSHKQNSAILWRMYSNDAVRVA